MTEAGLAPASSAAVAADALTHLQILEAESIHIIREVVAEAQNPVMLFSVGKDSGVMLELARRAFAPAPIPFPLLHIDCRWDFQDMYRLRDALTERYGLRMLVHASAAADDPAVNPFDLSSQEFTRLTLTEALKEALTKYGFDAAFCGGRRDEEKSRAKERIFSFRDRFQQWDPRNQRPELWQHYNPKVRPGESMRVFPLSNWTELDVWLYTEWRNIPLVPLYFAAERPVVERQGQYILCDDQRMRFLPGERPQWRKVRFRTLGAYPLTAGCLSEASTVRDIIAELLATRTSERSGRLIDRDEDSSMEKKKREGYF
ncbi:MAG: sulfate adenylyltransferase subunit CysD [Planctomycetota bacterium]|nr:sulfate adenylyltransferase subunit CysD [Planctomycetota bacterium]MCX8040368.1 sulfate adenylyltransferase subunit CysD [Planctomycetota bacterium]MDW8373744.1 sulfate adenylyltransferase subunit CysD [Planctomycetota bacterium]